MSKVVTTSWDEDNGIDVAEETPESIHGSSIPSCSEVRSPRTLTRSTRSLTGAAALVDFG
jgi:hypothetical protein